MKYPEFILLFSLLVAPVQYLLVIFSKKRNIEFVLPGAYLVLLLCTISNKALLPVIDDTNLLYLIIPSILLSLVLKRIKRRLVYHSLVVMLSTINGLLVSFPLIVLFAYFRS